MATVVFTSAIAWGDVFPLVPVAQRLVADGHTVRFVVPGGFHELLSGLGFEVLPAGFELSPRELERDSSMDADRWGGLHWGRGIMRRYLLPHTTTAYQALERACVGADLVVTQQTLPFARIVAERTGIPWATFVLVPMGVPSASGLDGERTGALATAGRRLMYRAADQFWRVWLGGRQVRRLRADLGLPRLTTSIPVAGVSPHLVVVAHSPAFVRRPDDWPETITLTGLSTWEWPSTRMPAGLMDFVSAGDPPVLVTLGSAPMVGIREFLDDAVSALRNLGLRGLFLVRHEAAAGDLGADMAVFPGGPLREVMRHSRAIIHKGGYGTTSAALLAGCPMVVVGRQLEHQWYARRAETLGIGLPAPWRPGAGPALASAVRRVINEPSFTERATAMADRLAAEDGPGQAARKLINLVGALPPVREGT